MVPTESETWGTSESGAASSSGFHFPTTGNHLTSAFDRFGATNATGSGSGFSFGAMSMGEGFSSGSAHVENDPEESKEDSIDNDAVKESKED